LKIYTREESEFYRTAVITAVEVFEKRGFNYLYLPVWEPLSIQEKALGELSRNSLTFRDFETGDPVALRLDFTTQVVRYVSLLRERNFPIRFYYVGPVFEYTSRLDQKEEAGVEIIGDRSLKADCEVIIVLWELLNKLGFDDLTVSVGHTSVVETILLEVEQSKKNEVKTAFREKNITFLSTIFGQDSTPTNLVIKQGGYEVLEDLENYNLQEVALQLEEVGKTLEAEGVDFIFDLTEVRDFPYYSGIVFEIFHKRMGSPVGGGGRYDRLSAIVGEEFPATGGAVYLSKLVP